MAKTSVPAEVVASVDAEIQAVAERIGKPIQGIDYDRLFYMKLAKDYKPAPIRRCLENWHEPIVGRSKEAKLAAKKADQELGQKFGQHVATYSQYYATAKMSGIPFPYERPESDESDTTVYGEDVFERKGDWTEAILEAQKKEAIAEKLKEVFQKGTHGDGPEDTEDMDDLAAALGLEF